MITIFTAPTQRQPRTAIALSISWVLLFSGTAFLAYAGYVTADAAMYQRIQATTFESAKPAPSRHATSDAALPRNLAIGDLIGEIGIPRVGMKAIVVEGDSPKILRRAVGHVPGTAIPGEAGNAALAGHRDTLFRPLRNVRLGDIVTFDLPSGHLRYEVRAVQVVSPDETGVLQSTGSAELTLITCFPFSYVGSAPNRYVIRASQVAQHP